MVPLPFGVARVNFFVIYSGTMHCHNKNNLNL